MSSSQDKTEPLSKKPEEVFEEIYENQFPVHVDDYYADYLTLQTKAQSDPNLLTPIIPLHSPETDIWIPPMGKDSGSFKLDVFYQAMLNAIPDPEEPNACYLVYPSVNPRDNKVDKILMCRFPRVLLAEIDILARQHQEELSRVQVRHREQLQYVPNTRRIVIKGYENNSTRYLYDNPIYSQQQTTKQIYQTFNTSTLLTGTRTWGNKLHFKHVRMRRDKYKFYWYLQDKNILD